MNYFFNFTTVLLFLLKLTLMQNLKLYYLQFLCKLQFCGSYSADNENRDVTYSTDNENRGVTYSTDNENRGVTYSTDNENRGAYSTVNENRDVIYSAVNANRDVTYSACNENRDVTISADSEDINYVQIQMPSVSQSTSICSHPIAVIESESDDSNPYYQSHQLLSAVADDASCSAIVATATSPTDAS